LSVFFCIWVQSSRQVFFEGMTSAVPIGAGDGFVALRSAAKNLPALAIWKTMLRPWLMTFAPILISFSFRLNIDQSLIGSGAANVRKKLPRL
jgi:hypothetical protein